MPWSVHYFKGDSGNVQNISVLYVNGGEVMPQEVEAFCKPASYHLFHDVLVQWVLIYFEAGEYSNKALYAPYVVKMTVSEDDCLRLQVLGLKEIRKLFEPVRGRHSGVCY